MNRRLVVLAAMVALTIAATSVTTAQSRLYGTIGSGGGGSTLVELDPQTGGVLRTVGAVGYTVNGLTYDAVSGTLYGGTAIGDESYNGLIAIDLVTGAGAPVGVQGWGLSDRAAVTCVATNSAGDMYGWWDPSVDDLVSIDKATGVATWVGESGMGTAGYGLAFDNSDQLYLFEYSSAYEVDTSTGTLVGGGSIAGFSEYGNQLHHGDFDPETGLYYGISSAWSNPRAIYVVDMDTLSIIETLPTIDGLHTLTFIPAGGPVAIPAPGAILLGSLGAGFVAWLRRRSLL